MYIMPCFVTYTVRCLSIMHYRFSSMHTSSRHEALHQCGLLLGHCRRRWTNSKPTLGPRYVLAGLPSDAPDNPVNIHLEFSFELIYRPPLRFNPLIAKLFNLNFTHLKLSLADAIHNFKVSENYSDLTKWMWTIFKSC